MKTYDTAALETMDRTESVGMMAAAKLTGLAVAEISRMVKCGRLAIKKLPCKAKPEVIVGDLIDMIRWKNQKAHIANIRKLRNQTTPKGTAAPVADRVVVGILEEALDRKPAFVAVPDNAETIGDLIIIAEAAARIERDNAKALEIQTWVAWLETL